MADEVEIGNVGGENGVASEATLKSLSRAIEKLASSSGKDPTKEAGKVQKQYNDVIKSGVTVSTKNRDALKKGTETTKKATQATNKFSRALAGAGVAAISSVVQSIKGFATQIIAGGNQLQDFTQHIPLVGGLVSPFAAILDNSISSFRELSNVGASFNNSITEMRYAAAGLELSLDEMSSMISGNSESLRLLGGTVGEGVARFAAINRNMKATGDFAALKQMGFTVEQINEGMSDYTALQSRLGRLQRMDNAQIAQGSARYMQTLDRLTKITGKSREQMEATLRAQAQDAGIRTLLNQFDPLSDEFANLQESLALIEEVGGPTATAMKDLLDGMVSSPETGQFLAMLGEGGPAIQQALEDIGDGADPQVLLNAMQNAGGDLQRFANMDADARKQYIDLLRDTNPAMADFLDASTRMIEVGSADAQAARDEQANRDEITRSLTTFDDSIRAMRATIAQAILDSGLFENMADMVASFADLFKPEGSLVSGINDFIDEIVFFIEDVKALGFKEAFKGLFAEGGAFEGIGESIKSALTTTLLGAGAVIAGGIVAAMTAKSVIGLVGRGISGAFSGLFSGGGAGGGGGGGGGGRRRGGGGGAGRAGAGLGSFLGNMGGGAMTGAAKGLQAFAHPMVPIGAAALGAAVVAIGAGIAGATWLIGSALPTLRDGLASFETLDGAALSQAGDGMAAVAVGMAAFGAGSAVSGLGSLVGGITEGIAGLFGAEDPMDKMVRFASYDIDADKVKNNAEAMVAFSAAMAAQGAASAAGGVGGLVGGIADGIMSFFGGNEDPAEAVKRFGDMDINISGVTNNANAIMAMSDAMNSFSADSLDNSGITAYNEALQSLVETLKDLNAELSRDNNGFSFGTGTNAGDVLGNISTSSAGSAESMNQLNTLMTQMLEILGDMATDIDQTERNTRNLQGGNIANGYVSTTG